MSNFTSHKSALVLALLSCLLAAGLALGQEGGRLVVHAGHVVVSARSPVLHQQSMIIESGRILDIVPGYVATEGSQILDLKDYWVAPGLIDMHAHVTLLLRDSGASVFDELMLARLKRPSMTVLEAIVYSQDMLRQGFTTLRVPGDPTGVLFDLRDAISRGIVPGPTLMGTQAQITVSGGDYDPLALPGFDQRTLTLMDNHGVCSGVDDCRRAVRQEVRSGADMIKLRISGSGGAEGTFYETEAELKAMIDMAHRLDRRVAVHSRGPEGALLALVLGADSIEHGLPPDSGFDRFRNIETGAASTWFVPTLTAFWAISEEMPNHAGPSPLELATARLRTAYEAGVPIAFGTDAGAFPHTEAHREFLLMREAGMSDPDIFDAATLTAAQALGRAREIGTLQPGRQADFIVLRDNPLADVARLRNVEHVVKAGRLFRLQPSAAIE